MAINPDLTTYRITFDRIGRWIPREPTEFQVASVRELHLAIYKHCIKRIVSKELDVTIDLDAERGWLDGGRVGQFKVEVAR